MGKFKNKHLILIYVLVYPDKNVFLISQTKRYFLKPTPLNKIVFGCCKVYFEGVIF